MEMGRPKTSYPDLPPRMTARTLKSGKVLFYYTGNGKKEALGGELNAALHKYADLDTSEAPGGSGAKLAKVFDEWEKDGIRIGKRGKIRSPKTQHEYSLALKELHKGFAEGTFDTVKPVHIKQYLSKRSAKVMANREIAVFSIIWNWARGTGKTDLPNPCDGIDRNHEEPRDRYVHDQEYRPVWDEAVFWLQDAMDLLLLTYQRESDVLKARNGFPDVSDGRLWFKQGKTKKKVGFRITGELQDVVKRCAERPRKVASLYLVSDENGQPISLDRLEKAFAKTRKAAKAKAKAEGRVLAVDWQLRDLRAKAVSDTNDIKQASERAAHADERITKRVYDRTRGRKVEPLR